MRSLRSTLGHWERWPPTKCATCWRTSPLWVSCPCCSFRRGAARRQDYVTWTSFFFLLDPDEPIWRVCQKDGWTDVCSPAETAAALRCGPQDLCPWRSEALVRHDGPPQKAIVPNLVSCEPDLSEAVAWKLAEMTLFFLFQLGGESENHGHVPTWSEGPTVHHKNFQPALTTHLGLEIVQQPLIRPEVQIAYSDTAYKECATVAGDYSAAPLTWKELLAEEAQPDVPATSVVPTANGAQAGNRSHWIYLLIFFVVVLSC